MSAIGAKRTFVSDRIIVHYGKLRRRAGSMMDWTDALISALSTLHYPISRGATCAKAVQQQKQTWQTG
jgi:hypothetical protein